MQAPNVWNFGAGPAKIPTSVLQRAQAELLNYNNNGMSIMELSHRSKEFDNLNNKTQRDLRTLLNIPNNYKILFMQGGGNTQFAAIVYNLLAAKRHQLDEDLEEEFNPPLDYLITGSCGSKAAYVYYCDNETVNGVEFNHIPEIDPSVPLVCDMSSNILSRRFDVSKFGVIYAGAQKNIGAAGLTVVIVRDDLLIRSKNFDNKNSGIPMIPSMLDYKIMADHNSLYNTPPMFSIYISSLVFEWMLELGGVEAIEKTNLIKAKKLYETIDNSKIYKSPVEKSVRSRMNVPFRIQREELESEFLKGAIELGMLQLKGHRSVGGIRASIYNAMTLEGVDFLIEYMMEFEKKHSQ
ncbi:2480_t:CDS:2 [Racocetra persica]|uniref:2480_t:CDS:1 n=1 Tax=Racocetra persica TaxID=160502 RepID=A0ACA9NT16_9GLOM|nr:2480_t:CDS:2 [Racocetra persica]